MKLGFLGVGHLAEALLKGLLRAGFDPSDIVLAPRGKGPALAAEHGFGLATDNAALVQACGIVLLATRPVDAAAAVRDLPWRMDQILISACAGVPIGALSAAASEPRIVRIMPLTAAELGASPTAVFPMVPELAAFLGAIGTTIPLSSEGQFEAATVSAAVYGWALALIRAGADWGSRNSLDPQTARALMAQTFVAAGRMQGELDAPMDEILASLLTPGGITEAGLDHLMHHHVPEAWDGACDLVLNKLRGHT
ncbi:MAG: pyrroline-5-carboxylate reductase dimerization domain-containing protein [Pseudomonadota bacterium]